MSAFVLAWAAWALAFAIIEGIAVATHGTTLSACVWWLLSKRYGRIPVVTVCVWLIWHWLLEHSLAPQMRKTYADDGLLAAFTMFYAWLAGRKQ